MGTNVEIVLGLFDAQNVSVSIMHTFHTTRETQARLFHHLTSPIPLQTDDY